MADVEYIPKTLPFSHQERIFSQTRDLKSYAIFWEQGTGKTKLGIDTAAWLYLTKRIDAVLVVAPNSIHTNWATDELPVHLPDMVRAESRWHIYHSSKANTKRHEAQVKELFWHKGLKWLFISYDGFMTKKGKKVVWDYLRKHRVLYILDESARIKNANAKRTKSIQASAKYAEFRRIMTGTPVANSPYDVYTQVRFLDEKFFMRHAIGSPLAFRNTFGVIREFYDEKSGKTRTFTVGYQNLEVLKEWLKPISSRVTKDEVLDLPPKLYSRRMFDLTPKQRALYEKLKVEYMAELAHGELVSAPLVLTRLLRFQQITSGYVPDDEGKLHLLASPNPRLALLEDFLEDIPHQAIIWATFNQDLDQIMGLLGDDAVRFDGQVKQDQREVNKQAFKAGDFKYLVAKASVAGEGLTLNEAKTEVYYNNSFNLTHRLQSEDRAHRIGQDASVNIVDFAAANTVDTHIIASLRRKFNIASQVTGDQAKDWL